MRAGRLAVLQYWAVQNWQYLVVQDWQYRSGSLGQCRTSSTGQYRTDITVQHRAVRLAVLDSIGVTVVYCRVHDHLFQPGDPCLVADRDLLNVSCV